MEPHFLLAKMSTDTALARVGHGALPCAPVQPGVRRRRRLMALLRVTVR
jgi:hypothetical protein